MAYFIADQFLQGSSQIYTRPNPGDERYDLECREERDYYPLFFLFWSIVFFQRCVFFGF